MSYVQNPSTSPVFRVSRYRRSQASQREQALYAVTSSSSSPVACASCHAVAAIGTTIWIWPYPTSDIFTLAGSCPADSWPTGRCSLKNAMWLLRATSAGPGWPGGVSTKAASVL